MYEKSFVCPCTKSFCSIFIQSFKKHSYMKQICNTKFYDSGVIFSWVLLIGVTQTHAHTNTHIHRRKAKTVVFGFRTPHKDFIYQILLFKNFTQNQYFKYHYMGKRK